MCQSVIFSYSIVVWWCGQRIMMTKHHRIRVGRKNVFMSEVRNVTIDHFLLENQISFICPILPSIGQKRVSYKANGHQMTCC